MLKAFFISLMILFAFSEASNAQDLDLRDWTAYVSPLNVSSADVDSEGNIYVASDGGGFKFDISISTFSLFDNINALLSLDINVVKVNKLSSEVYFASSDGYLDILGTDGKWSHITGIATSNFSNKSINDIFFHNSRAYFVGGFGITIFDADKKIFIENSPRFGRFNNSAVVNKIIIYNDLIYLATTQGIAFTQLNSILADPESWQTFSPESNNLDIKDIEIINGEIFILSEESIYRAIIQNDDISYELVENITGITDIANYNEQLIFSQYGFVLNLSRDIYYNNSNFLISGIDVAEGKIITKFPSNGIDVIDENLTFTNLKPNTPASNGFNDLEIMPDGTIWIAADYLGQGIGKGFMKFDGKIWTNFTSQDYPEIKSNGYCWISAVDENRVAVSNFGSGLLFYNQSDNSFIRYDTTNSAFTGNKDDNFVVAGENRTDKFGNTWVVNFAEEGQGPALIAFTPEGKSYGFENRAIPSNRKFYQLAIDSYNTKWLGSYPIVGSAVMYFNENGTLDNTNDDANGIITSSSVSGLNSNETNSIEIDKTGLVWIGSVAGLSVIINPSAVLGSGELVVRSINILGSISVNDIMVDALNNKWVATEQGVWVLNPDATELLGVIDMSNSKLPTNSILSLASNENTGTIYFGTGKGLFSAKSLYIKPLEAYSLKCYPQPFKSQEHNSMIIDGLANGSNIRILTINGQLIQIISTESRTAVWDGRDINGELVDTGVYLVVTSSSGTDASSVMKIAVINDR